MKTKIIINSLLIIFILHLLLENIDFNFQIGDLNMESYQNKKNDDQTLKFLTDVNNNHLLNNKLNMKDKLLDYVSQVSVKPSNIYESDNNVPNFNSNVENISKYYERNNNYDNIEKLQKNNYKSIDKVSGRQKVSEDTVSSVSWKYDNELTMNGGDMGGIFGYDSLDSNYAVIGSEGKSCSPTGCSINSDDLRMGMGNPNKETRLTN